jgi:small-conductance mechanosensitive channel
LLLLDRSIKPGDIIEMPNGAFGWVEKMGARYTEIVTRDNKSYLIPNENFITQQVVNWSHGNTLVRLEVEFGVHYDSDPHQVQILAQQAACRPARVVSEPAPLCHLIAFGENALNFKLRFWIKDAEQGVTNIRGDVLLSLWDIFKENEIKIPYPHRMVYLHEANNPLPMGKRVVKKA